MIKDAQNKFPINPLSLKRWSPRAFSTKKVEIEKLQSLFEAARWSASAGNEQPWRYIVGLNHDETWRKIFDILEEGNQVWVKNAPVLIITIGKKTRGKRNVDNGYFKYDVGQSAAHLSIEATHLGLHVHQMGGFFPEKAIELFDIPFDYQPLSAICIGYIGDPEILPEDQKKSEIAFRTRKEFDEFVFTEKFGQRTNLF